MVNKSVEQVFDGIKNLYRAYLILFIGSIIAEAFILSILYLIKQSTPPIYPSYIEPVDISKRQTAILIALLAPLAIVGLLSFYYQYRGFKVLQEHSRRYRVGFNGAKVAIISLVLILTTIALTPLPYTETIEQLHWEAMQVRRTLQAMLVSSFTILVIGLLMVSIGLWRLSNKYHSVLIKIGIPLLFIGLAIAVIGFAGLILIILGLKSILKELGIKKRIPPPPPPPPSILET